MTEVTTPEQLAEMLRSGEIRRVGIDGTDGVGKTTLAKAVASQLGLQLFSVDRYLKKNQGGFLEFINYDRLRSDVIAEPGFVIESICLLQVLQRAHIAIDALVYVKRYHLGIWADERELDLNEPLEVFLEQERQLVSMLAEEGTPIADLGLAEEIIRYHHATRPHTRANIISRRDDP